MRCHPQQRFPEIHHQNNVPIMPTASEQQTNQPPLYPDNDVDDDQLQLKGGSPSPSAAESNNDDGAGVVSDIVAAAAAASAAPSDEVDAVNATMSSLGENVAVAGAAIDFSRSVVDEYPTFHPPVEEATAVSAVESQDPMLALQIACKIKDKPSRDRALIQALRDSRRELEYAESANSRATDRLGAAKEVYDLCAQCLAGYTPLETRSSAKKKGSSFAAVGLGCGVDNYNVDQEAKRIKLEEPAVVDGGHDAHIFQPAVMDTTDVSINAISTPRMKGQVQPEGTNVTLPTNEIYLPEYFTVGVNMEESTVTQFRDSFFLHLTKNQADASTIETWKPPPHNANLKSKTQLDEWIHIATHWNTGADGLDAGAFRAKHKTWYSRMKPVSYNLGRRTGIHLRQLDVGGYEGRDYKGMTVLCRYNKAGNKSTVYLEVPRVS